MDHCFDAECTGKKVTCAWIFGCNLYIFYYKLLLNGFRNVLLRNVCRNPVSAKTSSNGVSEVVFLVSHPTIVFLNLLVTWNPPKILKDQRSMYDNVANGWKVNDWLGCMMHFLIIMDYNCSLSIRDLNFSQYYIIDEFEVFYDLFITNVLINIISFLIVWWGLMNENPVQWRFFDD